MAALRLTARDRATLAERARHATEAREARRALALLDLGAGEPPDRVAGRYLVSRSTVYQWAARWRDTSRPRGDRLRDADRSGRPPQARDAVEAALAGLMPTSPTGHGYRHPAWTTPLLLAHLRRRGVEASEATVRRALHRDRVPVEAAPVRAEPPGRALAAVKRGLQRGLRGRGRTVVLFTDATILTETPPLRACWSPMGEQAEVPITGNRAKAVLYGALNPATGKLWLDEAAWWNQQSFQGHLRNVRSVWRGWRIVLFLDRGSPHTARASRELAAELGIELRFLPTACPELNPVEGLWRHAKGRVLANESTPDLADSLGRACDELFMMSNTERLRIAGVLSGNFWLPT